ncbi:MAG: hypothetical protein QOG64_503 [Acidimicrobiaceae bacterium]|nr:hypothetical protein [Acidimicrobiaceae bacterium]
MDADLVLEGGGVKGIGLVAAIAALEQEGYTFHRVGGTSAGAIVGALVAAGMPVSRLQTIMREVDYCKFRDATRLDRLGPPGKALSLLTARGIYKGDYVRDWVADRLAELNVRTFADLAIDDPHSSLPPEKAFRLVVHTSDVTKGELVRLPWDYARYGLDPATQSVADAVRASMSIPFFYRPATIGAAKLRSTCVDGGMLSNFPIDVFDRTDGKAPRWPTFGIKLSAKPEANRDVKPVRGVLGLGLAMIATMMNFHDQMHLDDPSVLARTMFVDTMGIKATDFDIDSTKQDALAANGEEAARAFLKGWDFTKYVQEFR